jgi:GPI ethanolamine phosphate transferase 1
VTTLSFFFLVKDEGSWLAIGMSISHFIVSSAMVIIQLLLTAFAAGIVRGAGAGAIAGTKKS